MEKITIQNNTIDNYIPITPTKPQTGYIHKEESQQFSSLEYNYDGVNNIPETSTADTYGEITTRKALISEVKDIPTASANSATDYIGIVKYDVPHIIDETFSDFSLIDVQTNSYTELSTANIESLATPLFDLTDTDVKVISLFNGLQVVRIPKDKFNDLTQTPTVKKFGKYYIKISPKFIEAEVQNIVSRRQVSWQTVNPADSEGRRVVLTVSNANFNSTVWAFENNNMQRGRLHGSIIEVWDNSLTVKKQTKVSVENTVGLDGGSGSAAFVITPDNVGYDAPDQVVAITDILRIYPRETYFNPIYIEVDYQNKELDLSALIKFTKNDAARNLKTGVIEIYDENGIVIDSQGNINGTVVQAYQISTAANGDVEVRRHINL